ncbi:MAG: LLM class flavin-dependent oxidoreductase [Rhodospirillaceae bacterium]|jgi:alkanesulfonate monooxygenase SsuD/methylene tetrahydromethanopterin reductase-like flavin-dependent oxidoreductase (luciferase family)|nr:LLM class flavin-dependent oxidoreductase [Rhodospirillaceae bacterium]
MKFSYTHHMPYTGVGKADQDWPVPNKQFDTELGMKIFRAGIDNKVFAEECGFDWIGNNEHHMSPYGLMPNPNLIGACVAERTSKAMILQSGNIVPIVNPIRVAEEYAMLDMISGGRLVAGFMRGIPHEYIAYNVAPSESYGRMNEAIELIKKAWTEPEPFGWEGEHYQYRAVSIWPKPAQKPHPEIVMSASSDASARLAAEHKATMGVLRIQSYDTAHRSIDVYKEHARAHGWEPRSRNIILAMNCSIAPTKEEAMETLTGGYDYFFNVLGGGIRTAQKLVVQKTRYFGDKEDAERQMEKLQSHKQLTLEERMERGLVMCGTPDMAIEQITRLYEEFGHGITNLSIKIGNVPDEKVYQTLELLRDEVIPAVRHLGEEEGVAAAE